MRMNVVSSLNDKYVKYACVMLTSLLRTQKKENEIHVYLLNRSLTEENQKYLSDCVFGYGGQLHLIHVDDALFSEFPTSEVWTHEAYFRLVLLDILPESIDRLLYLDVDTIVNKPLDEMYSSDFDGLDIIAQIDGSSAPFGDARDRIFEKWIQAGTLTYCCSGVALWNVKQMREHYDFNSYLEVAQSLNFGMVAPDQDLLNYVHQDHIRAFEDPDLYGLYAKHAYNCGQRYEDVKAKTYIVHFAGQKPWLGQYIHFDIEQLWWDNAKLTPFYSELMEEYMNGVILNPLIYNTMAQSMEEKQALQENLNQSMEISQKLLAALDNGK